MCVCCIKAVLPCGVIPGLPVPAVERGEASLPSSVCFWLPGSDERDCAVLAERGDWLPLPSRTVFMR